MNVALIPVIEVDYYNEGVPVPDNSPYWEYPEDWQAYLDKSMKKYGFPEPFITYKTGYPFFRVTDIHKDNLIKIVNEHFDIITSETGYTEDDINPLGGGYILNISGEDKLFPQCCQDLGDIGYWEDIVKHQKATYHSGHPQVEVTFDNDHVIFNCGDESEEFAPPTSQEIKVPIKELDKAYERVKEELAEFARRLNNIYDELEYQPKQYALEQILINGVYDSDTAPEIPNPETETNSTKQSWFRKLWS